jgi:hypothetical protein
MGSALNTTPAPDEAGRPHGRTARSLPPVSNRALLGIAGLAVLSVYVLVWLGAVYGDQLSLTTRAIGYAAACLWLVAGSVAGSLLLRRVRGERLSWRALWAPWDSGLKSEKGWGTWWLGLDLGAAAMAAVLTFVALGFFLVPRAGGTSSVGPSDSGTATSESDGGPDRRPSTLGVTWTVDEPLRTETPATRPVDQRDVRVALRVTDPERPNCAADYHWTLSRGASESSEFEGRDTCIVEVAMRPESNYTLRVARGHPTAATGQADARVRRLLVASFGDSVASGEGNPAASKPKWEDSSRCNRSFIAGPRQAAEMTAAASDHAYVVFFHLACTGAWIDGIGAPRKFGVHPNLLPRVGEGQPSEVALFDQRVHPGDGDVIVLLSVGANDLGFGPILRACLKPLRLRCVKKFAGFPLSELLASRFAQLRLSFDRLARVRPFDGDRVYITQYFDPLRDQRGHLCRIGRISPGEAAWAENAILKPLNALVHDEAKDHHWTLISGVARAFRDHGYCSRASWIVHISRALRNWNLSGPFHPNALGQALYGRLIFAAVKPSVGG